MRSLSVPIPQRLPQAEAWSLPFLFLATGFLATNLLPYSAPEAFLAASAILAAYAAFFMGRQWLNYGVCAGTFALLWIVSGLIPSPYTVLLVLGIGILSTKPDISRPTAYLFIAVLAYLSLADSGFLWVLDDAVGRSVVRRIRAWIQVADSTSAQSILQAWPFITIAALLARRVAEPSRSQYVRTGIGRIVILTIAVALSLFAKHPWPLALLAVYAISGFENGTERSSVPWPRPLLLARSAYAAVFFGAILALAGVWGMSTARPVKVAMTPVGLGKLAPDVGAIVSSKMDYEANFGNLHGLFQRNGIEVVKLRQSWQLGDLNGVSTLFVINPTVPATPDQVRTIYGRVADGMTLVVAGDHTNMMKVGDACASFLKPIPIRLNFDSAIPAEENSGWHKALWVAPSLRRVVTTASSVDISVGASLRIGEGVQPLIVGLKGFSDRGNSENKPGFLGDMKFNGGEVQNGQILSAQTGYGRGRVVVFGDTSSFQDGSLSQSGRLTLSTVGQARLPSGAASMLQVGGASLIFLGLILASVSKRTFLVTAGITAVVLAIVGHPEVGPNPRVSHKDAYVFDTSAFPQYPGEFPDEKTYKFSWVLGRRSVPLFFGDALQSLADRPRGILVAAPLAPIPAHRSSLLKRYVEEGGRLLIFTGHQHHQNTSGLLAGFGLSLDPVPLGGNGTTEIVDPTLRKGVELPDTKDEHGHNHSPKPIRQYLVDACEILGEGQALLKTFGRTTGIYKQVGRGSVIVVADSRFFTDKALGEALEINVDTARLLYELSAYREASN